MSVRCFTWNDLPDLLEFASLIQSGGAPQDREVTRRNLREVLEQPWLEPWENCLLLEVEGQIRGYCLIFPELPIKRAVLAPDIAGDLAGSQEEAKLIDRAVARSWELGTVVAHLCLSQDSPRRHLLESKGFTLERVYWDMLWNIEWLPQTGVPAGFRIGSFQPGDAATLTQIQNDAFTGTWGFAPNTIEQIEYRSSMSNTAHPGILLLYSGDRVAGYCWTCFAPSNGKLKGIIGMIGVSPDFRGRGISKPLLVAGMEYLKSAGVAEIGLHVDGINAPAIALYKSVGFQKVGELHWYELSTQPT